jgi:hypothetical protein
MKILLSLAFLVSILSANFAKASDTILNPGESILIKDSSGQDQRVSCSASNPAANFCICKQQMPAVYDLWGLEHYNNDGQLTSYVASSISGKAECERLRGEHPICRKP